MNKYIHNTSGAEKIYMGTVVADNAYYLIPELQRLRFKDDDQLVADITADNARMSRDGVADLSVADSLVFLQLDDATSITSITVDTTAPNNGDYLIYNSTSEKYEPGKSPSPIGALLSYNFLSNGNTADKWLGYSNSATSSETLPLLMPQGSTLMGLLFSNVDNDVDINALVYLNGVLAYTWEIRNKRVAWNVGAISVPANQGDRVSVFLQKYTGGSGDSTAQDPILTALFKITSESAADSGIQNGL